MRAAERDVMDMMVQMYEQGLQRLKDLIRKTHPELLVDFSTLEAQLLEDLYKEGLLGPDRTSRERNRIVHDLNRFTYQHFETDFLSFCYTSSQNMVEAPLVQEVPAISDQGHDSDWRGGMEIKLLERSYLLHDPILITHSSDESARHYHAQAQQLRSSRLVWLKRVVILQDTPLALRLKSALEKEARLLEELATDKQRKFPSLIQQDETEMSATIAYESIHGHTLSQVFGPFTKPLEPQLVASLLQMITRICTQLAVLHRRELAHRHLTPDVILLLHNNQTVLRDVGRAAYHFEIGEGPPLYRAPEQVGRLLHVPGPATDIYQLGRLLYHILTGNPLSLPDRVEAPYTHNNKLPPALQDVLMRACAFDTKDRWPSIQDFSNALKHIVADEIRGTM
jgi:serine/threonine protein kinase